MLHLAVLIPLGALSAAGCGGDTGSSTGASAGTVTTGAGSGATTDTPQATGTPTTSGGSTTQESPGDASTSTSGGEVTSNTSNSGSGEVTSGASDSSSGGSTQGAISEGTDATGSESTGGESTGGALPVAYFDCTELTVVDLQLKETISGAFTAEGVPIDVLATMVKGGAIDFQIAVAAPVAADDPYAADVAFWENELTATAWDVNPPGDPTGDRRYIFVPEGAQFVAKFSLFYYRIYEGGGNGQFEFECLEK